MKEWAVYSFLALFIWGLWGFFPKMAISCLEPKCAFFFQVVGGIGTGLLAVLFMKPDVFAANLKGIVPALLTGAAGSLGGICFLYALRGGKVSVIAPLTALYPVISVALAVLFLKEKVSPVQCAGVALAVVSVILISHE
ncbi:MAG: EamA family transporter [Desulfobacteraceae bacterium]|nr:EamA family transporter [Desulfobacteraceae bacterium]